MFEDLGEGCIVVAEGVGIGSDGCRRLDQYCLGSIAVEEYGQALGRFGRNVTDGCQILVSLEQQT